MMLPERVILGEDLSDLPGRLDSANRMCQKYITSLGASLLWARDRDAIYNGLMRVLRGVQIPSYVINGIYDDPRLPKCLTRLDLALLLAGNIPFCPDDNVPALLRISNQLLTTQKI
jgi:hypothetical protein